jgi:hypothetical protein
VNWDIAQVSRLERGNSGSVYREHGKSGRKQLAVVIA